MEVHELPLGVKEEIINNNVVLPCNVSIELFWTQSQERTVRFPDIKGTLTQYSNIRDDGKAFITEL